MNKNHSITGAPEDISFWASILAWLGFSRGYFARGIDEPRDLRVPFCYTKKMSLFFLTTIQEKTFATLSDEPQSVTELALLAKLPRTSVAKALTMLEKIGLAKGRKLREKNKHVYMRQDVDRIEQKIENFKESVLKEKNTVKNLRWQKRVR